MLRTQDDTEQGSQWLIECPIVHFPHNPPSIPYILYQNVFIASIDQGMHELEDRLPVNGQVPHVS